MGIWAKDAGRVYWPFPHCTYLLGRWYDNGLRMNEGDIALFLLIRYHAILYHHCYIHRIPLLSSERPYWGNTLHMEQMVSILLGT